MDLGTGCGIIPLVLARELGRKDITGLELQRRLFSLAERNVYLNRCEREVSLVLGDLRRVGGTVRGGQLRACAVQSAVPGAGFGAQQRVHGEGGCSA
ncbi:50S ribosomal protein L11 methyltransferase [Corallococcus macrosporus]|uniref:50S ribosomal protein L11 methyltransferase n=1 Tax=Corallococcus macrosporus TaxID=35 RepID=UPI0003087FC6|nr:50S ribosomal protein L11 methyltransferase [Corallococcus macrosporus]